MGRKKEEKEKRKKFTARVVVRFVNTCLPAIRTGVA